MSSRSSRRIACLGSVALLGLGISGCALSASFETSSDSASDLVSSPFESSSRSSPERSADVGTATEVWALEDRDVDALRRTLAAVTERHGVTDWEADAATCRGIGHGLRRADVSRDEYERIRGELASGDAEMLAWIESGYDASDAAP